MQDFSSAIKFGAAWAARLGLAPAQGRLSLVELTGLAPEAAALALCPAEAACLANFAYPARQRQWLGGRLAVKQAVLLMSGERPPSAWADLATVEIGVAADNRRPLLAFGPESRLPLHISISHSGDWAVGLAAFLPCGVDLQIFTSRIVRVAGKFTLPAEEARLAPLTGDDRVAALTLLWASKESIIKSVNCRPLLTFHDLELTGGEPLAGQSGRLHLRCRRSGPGLPASFISAVAWDDQQAVAVTVNPEHSP